jgi:dTDP-4-amino-4,6-dideoxygalactose transaminase
VTRAVLTHSCTAALEMAAILADLGPGDEVIMPSYTFVSTANAVALRGAVPVFADIRNDTLNLDETIVEVGVTPRTKAIFVVHYAGVCAEVLAEIPAETDSLDALVGLREFSYQRPIIGSRVIHQKDAVVFGDGG